MAKPSALRDKYADLLDELDCKPIIGSHSIGDLTLVANQVRWLLTQVAGDTNYLVGRGRCRSGEKMRADVRKAIMKRVSKQQN
jgi:hypothetical protein